MRVPGRIKRTWIDVEQGGGMGDNGLWESVEDGMKWLTSIKFVENGLMFRSW